jgi:hypothetical protein
MLVSVGVIMGMVGTVRESYNRPADDGEGGAGAPVLEHESHSD